MTTPVTAPAPHSDKFRLESVLGIGSKLNTLWMQAFYPFAGFGKGVSVHYSCELLRSISPQVRIGDNVYLAPKVWIDVVSEEMSPQPKIVIGDGCAIGRRCTISAGNQVFLEPDVLLAPSVLITDHGLYSHRGGAPEDSSKSWGRITIGRNCWLGINAVIACGSGELTLGHNSVVGANAVVTHSFPPFSVIGGNPAKLIKTYDPESGKWGRVHG
jgi:acetyltransferase-like isoleucine patch superfamily enzyme